MRRLASIVFSLDTDTRNRYTPEQLDKTVVRHYNNRTLEFTRRTRTVITMVT